MSSPDRCPEGCDLTGAPIPSNIREHYGDATHFSRAVGEYDMWLDRTVAWHCPDCGVTWSRSLAPVSE